MGASIQDANVGVREVNVEDGVNNETASHRASNWRIFRRQLPPKETLEDADVIPLATAGILSKLMFTWVSPMMATGFKRPLQSTDLWKMDPSRESLALSDKFLANLAKRQAAAAEHNARLATAKPSIARRAQWKIRAARSLPTDYAQFGANTTYAQRMETLETEWRKRSGVKHGSVAWALSDTFPRFWYCGPWKITSDACLLVYPLLIKEIIKFSQEVAAAHSKSEPLPSAGVGVGYAVALFALLSVAYTCLHQFFFRATHEGALMRSTLVAAVYRRAFKLSVGSRAKHSDGQLMTMLSADITRIDSATEYFHCAWTAPIVLVATVGLLCGQIGASGLLGFAIFILAVPLTTWNMKIGLKLRRRAVVWTEKRSALLQGILSSMSIVKMFTYELPFLERLRNMRAKELSSLRVLLFTRAANEAMTFSLPTIASVFAFIVYANTAKSFNPALIFTALSYFNSLRAPLNQIPKSLSMSADAITAVKRLSDFFEAQSVGEQIAISPKLDVAIQVDNATFEWPPATVDADDEKAAVAPESFAIRGLNMSIPHGRLVAIVGPVGSGKSSLLQGLIGDMTLTSGNVRFGGRLGYCQQAAWIQNATIRENIVFGQPWDQSRYWQCVWKASLIPDLEMLAAGDQTEIGEKGINISGGQKQRINIARALYYDSDIVLLDDPLSAVDAHVGLALFNDAILGLRAAGKTVLLATHALHLLPQVDYIYTILDGKIVEEGSYAEVMRSEGAFRLLMESYGGAGEHKDKVEEKAEVQVVDNPLNDKVMSEKVMIEEGPLEKSPSKNNPLEGRLMAAEDRKTGAVGKAVYLAYFKSGGWMWLVFAVGLATIMQVASSMSIIWLTYWSDNKFTQAGSFYQGIYGMLGIVTALFTFLAGMAMANLSINASTTLYDQSLKHVLFSPMRFFDTTPLGRMMGVFGKDIDAIDNVVPEVWRLMLLVIATLIGGIAVIAINFPYFVAVVFGVSWAYLYFAWYYRRTAREVKRLDSLFRGMHYSHFSESLSGRSTIRAYGETDRFIKENTHRLDLQNRAYLITKANSEWLQLRLAFVGNCLVMAIALMCGTAGGRTVAPAAVGMCLMYMGTTTGMLSGIAHLSIEIETSIERVLYYSDGTLPLEAPYEIPATLPRGTWPSSGSIKVEDAVMSYRAGLPPVLKGISFEVKPGERVGVVGRTGAGKTSITVALYRLVELTSGKISIDGIDISTLGLKTLRASIGIIPQDPVLFSGTLRSNLDPFDQRADATLHDALKRACLRGRFTLDMPIEEGGSNLSIGERSLVSLARAFVEDSTIMVLDEATAAVDLETDAKIQQVIRDECSRSNKTLLCIAHRLRTIIGWDKILVMDAGQVAEFASPLELWDRGGIFQGMCERSSITRDEIVNEQRR